MVVERKEVYLDERCLGRAKKMMIRGKRMVFNRRRESWNSAENCYRAGKRYTGGG